ncbi:hypothetical protein QBC40DRAFT_213009, partial [Triangularia verruculosa]
MWPSSQSPPAPPGPPPAVHAHSHVNTRRSAADEEELPPPSYYSSVVQPERDGQQLVGTRDQPPRVGDRAPSLGPTVTFPTEKPVLVVFLRVCGCPFAEKTFTNLTTFSTTHPEITCIAVTQSPPAETDDWVISLGGAWSVTVVPDPELKLYRAWGLGENRSWYDWFVENLKVPLTSPTNVTSLDHTTGHGRRYTGGSKWQQGAGFGVDAGGVVRWVWVGGRVDEVVDFE